MLEELEEREFTAPTVEQAVNNACDYFNITNDRLKYEVTKSVTRGILRSKKLVTIIARPLRGGETNKISTPEGISVDPVSSEFEETVVNETNALLKLLGLNLHAEKYADEERFVINLSGPDRMYILNRDAEALEALQYILNKIAYAKPSYKKILLDSNGYRSQKEHQLIQLALSTAMKAKKQRRPQTLEPLNSYERRIIHMALADDKEVVTVSKGEGQAKRITISLV
jgi:spoIIIJ-associated protein